MLNLGILLALTCAIATQLGFLYKHKGANQAPTVDIRHPFRTAKQLYSCKWFAIGMAIAAGAWIFHVAALAYAPLSVVQAVLSTGVVIIAVMAERIFGFKVARRQWIGVGMTALGLLLLVITLPAAHGTHSAYSVAGMIAFEGAMLVIGALLIGGKHLGMPDHHHGIMLGAAAGVLFGVSDIAIKGLTGADGILGVVSSPWLAVTVGASVIAFYASARGLQDRRGRPGHRRHLDRRQRLLHPRRHHRLRRPDAGRHGRDHRPGLCLRARGRRRAGHPAAGPRCGGQRRSRVAQQLHQQLPQFLVPVGTDRLRQLL